MKKIICTILTIILLASSTICVWAEDNIREDPTIVPGSRQIVMLDEEFSAETIDYEWDSPDVSLYATTSTKSYSRVYRIYRTSDNVTMVKWTLTGTFEYNGTTSTCKSVSNNATNYYPSIYNVTDDTEGKSGCYALGYCEAQNLQTGKIYSHTIRFGVDPNGNII